MSTDAGTPPRSALLAAWGNAWLAGDARLADLVRRVGAYDDSHCVRGLAPEDLSLERALARLRADGVDRLRLVLPAPGDAVGLPGPGPFTTAALAASEGVLALRADGSGSGLVPALQVHGSPYDGTVTTVAWTAHAVSCPGPDPGPFLHDAEHDLRRGILECASTLADLDVARWRPEVADELTAMRRTVDLALPGSMAPRAVRLASLSARCRVIVDLALVDDGGSITAAEADARRRALAPLDQAARRALVAACTYPWQR